MGPLWRRHSRSNQSFYVPLHICLKHFFVSSIFIEISSSIKMTHPYVKKGIRDYQCGFRDNRSTIDQIFGIKQINKKAMEFKLILWAFLWTLRQLMIASTEIIYSAMAELNISRKLLIFSINFIKIIMNEPYVYSKATQGLRGISSTIYVKRMSWHFCSLTLLRSR